LKSWKKGAVYGFLFVPLLFIIAMLLMFILAMLRLETLGVLLDALVMLPLVPMSIIHRKFEITNLSFILTSILLWTLIGAIIGYLIERRNPSSSG
jgi:hypothetical protein